MGPPGPAGTIQLVERVFSSSTAAAGGTAECPTGTRVTAGGFETVTGTAFTGGQRAPVTVYYSSPRSSTVWAAATQFNGPPPADQTNFIKVWAVCATVAP